MGKLSLGVYSKSQFFLCVVKNPHSELTKAFLGGVKFMVTRIAISHEVPIVYLP